MARRKKWKALKPKIKKPQIVKPQIKPQIKIKSQARPQIKPQIKILKSKPKTTYVSKISINTDFLQNITNRLSKSKLLEIINQYSTINKNNPVFYNVGIRTPIIDVEYYRSIYDKFYSYDNGLSGFQTPNAQNWVSYDKVIQYNFFDDWNFVWDDFKSKNLNNPYLSKEMLDEELKYLEYRLELLKENKMWDRFFELINRNDNFDWEEIKFIYNSWSDRQFMYLGS